MFFSFFQPSSRHATAQRGEHGRRAVPCQCADLGYSDMMGPLLSYIHHWVTNKLQFRPQPGTRRGRKGKRGPLARTLDLQFHMPPPTGPQTLTANTTHVSLAVSLQVVPTSSVPTCQGLSGVLRSGAPRGRGLANLVPTNPAYRDPRLRVGPDRSPGPGVTERCSATSFFRLFTDAVASVTILPRSRRAI
jgi:hypothetical protein